MSKHTPGPWTVHEEHTGSPEHSTWWRIDSSARFHMAKLEVFDVTAKYANSEEHARNIMSEYYEMMSEARANALLGLALEICGMGDKVGKMRIEIDRKDIRRLYWEFMEGNIFFILNVDPNHAIKGNIRRSPLFKIMPLSFPVSWLDATTAQVKREMTELYRA